MKHRSYHECMLRKEKVDFRWSENHVANGIKIDRLGTSAVRTDFFQVPPLGFRILLVLIFLPAQVGSVRTAQPIPPEGMFYFEISVKRPSKHVGSLMGGFYWVGVCTDEARGKRRKPVLTG
eukprot:202287-Hanusia_phi.AAC.1